MTPKITTAIMLTITTSLFAAATPSAFADIRGTEIPVIPGIEIPDIGIDPDLINPPPDCGPMGGAPVYFPPPGVGWACLAIEDFLPDFDLE